MERDVGNDNRGNFRYIDALPGIIKMVDSREFWFAYAEEMGLLGHDGRSGPKSVRKKVNEI